MGGCRLLFKPSAARAFLALPRDIQKRLDKRLLALRDHPRPPGVKALTGVPGVLRLRVGDYRILYNYEMEPWVRKCASFAEERAADRDFWQQMTPDERVAAVGELRAQWAALTGARHEGFRRTVHVLERAER